MAIFISNKLVSFVQFLFVRNRPIAELDAALLKHGLINKASSIENIVSNELLLTSWDMSHQSPRLFSKWTYTNIQNNLYKGTKKIRDSTMLIDKKNQDYHMNLDDMVLASAASPTYFAPHEVNGAYYISGDYIAGSPAMYAYLHAYEKLDKDPHHIRVVNVGSLKVSPEKIDKHTGLYEWLNKLAKLCGPVKKRT